MTSRDGRSETEDLAGWTPDMDTSGPFGDQIERRVRQTRLASLFLQSPAFMAVLEGPQHVFVNANPTAYDLLGERDLIGRPVREVLPELGGEGFFELLDRVYESGESHVGSEEPVPLGRGGDDAPGPLHLSYSYHPLRDEDGRVSGILVHGIDVTERVRSRHRLRKRVRQQAAVAELGRSVLGMSSLPEIFRRVVETAVEAAGAEGGTIYRFDRGEQRLRLEASSGSRTPEGREARTERDGLPARALLEERALVSGGPPGEEGSGDGEGGGGGRAADSGDASRIAVPIPRGGDRPIGVLLVRSDGRGAFADQDVPALEAVAQIAGAAVTREESERFTETVARNLPGLLYRCRNDRDWTMEYLSQGTEELTGYPPAELTGEGSPAFADLLHPDDRRRVWHEVQTAVEEDRPFHLRYRIRSRSGEQKWVWEQGRGIRRETGSPFLLEGYIFDITELHEAEEEADRLSSVVRAAFQGYSDAVFVIELPERTIETCNAAAEQMFGVPRRELIGASTERLHVDHESYVGFGETAVPEVLESGSYRGEYRMRRGDGSTFPTEHSVTHVETPPNEPDRVLSIVRDISDRRRRQEQLERSRKLLRDYSRHLTTLQEEERADIAREVHDELGQSLTALKLQLEEIRRRVGGEEPAREKLEESLGLLRNTMDQVRDLSSSLRPSALDTLGLWEAIGQLVRRFRDETGVPTTYRRSDMPRIVEPDREIHVYRIVQEALTNVARHAQADRARVEADVSDGGCVVRVLDDGAGIPESPVASSDGHGLLGMRERARLLGADLAVRSREEGGTEVRLSIPGPDAAPETPVDGEG